MSARLVAAAPPDPFVRGECRRSPVWEAPRESLQILPWLVRRLAWVCFESYVDSDSAEAFR